MSNNNHNTEEMNLNKRVDILEKKLSTLINSLYAPVDIPTETVADGYLPLYASRTDAGADVYANEDMILYPGQARICRTGIKVAVPEGFEIQVRPRSGIASKTALRIANAPGTIDSGYRGEVGVILFNSAMPSPSMKDADLEACDAEGKPVKVEDLKRKGAIVIEKGDRIAQLVLARVYHANFKIIDDVSAIEGDRGGGFGHSGV